MRFGSRTLTMVMSVALGTTGAAWAQSAPAPAPGPGPASTAPEPVAPAPIPSLPPPGASATTAPPASPPPASTSAPPAAPPMPPIVYVDKLPTPGEVPPPPPAPPKLRDFYLSLETIKLLSRPFFEVDGEYRLHERVGVGGMVGLGRRIIGTMDKQFGWMLGVQGTFYPIGSFHHGLQLGAEVVYGGSSGRGKAGTLVIKQTGSEIGPGAFVGYKIESKLGLTFSIQAGARYMFYRVSVDDGTSQASAASGKAEVLGRLNFGWSF